MEDRVSKIHTSMEGRHLPAFVNQTIENELLSAKRKPNQPWHFKRTSLHLAIIHMYPRCTVELLLDCGVNPLLEDFWNARPSEYLPKDQYGEYFQDVGRYLLWREGGFLRCRNAICIIAHCPLFYKDLRLLLMKALWKTKENLAWCEN